MILCILVGLLRSALQFCSRCNAGVTVQVLSVTSGKEEGELLARAGAALHAAVVPGM